MLDLFAARAAEKGLELLYDIAEGTPRCVRGDPSRIRQVLVNLVGNAIKFTSVGEVVLWVSPSVGSPESLEFSVRDTGIGIPASAMDRLFESFSQVDASTTRKYGGTGLGLAISRRLAALMGGRLSAESQEGEGSTFRFTARLPVDPARVEDGMFDPVPTLAGRHVLIVDDNATSLHIVKSWVRRWGMVPVAVGNAAAALETGGSGRQFHIALLDRHMPQTDGETLARELRSAGRTCPLVLLSPVGHRAQSDALDGSVAKPLRPAHLRDLMVEVLARRNAAADSPPAPMPGRVIGVIAPGEGGQPVLKSVPAAGPGPRPIEVLLAEDNLVNQKVALQMLRALGYRADVAGNGLEVLDALGRQQYDVILLDVQMPEMDGLEVARRLVQERPDRDTRPWMIAVTANAMQGDRETCLAAGMDDYVSKPIRRAELHDSLQRARQELDRRGPSGPSTAALGR